MYLFIENIGIFPASYVSLPVIYDVFCGIDQETMRILVVNSSQNSLHTSERIDGDRHSQVRWMFRKGP